MLREIVPYAFIRVFNDQPSIKACLESIVPAISKGIICYHPAPPGIKTDRSIEIVEDFVQKNPGFRLVRYPQPVIPANHALYLNKETLIQLDLSWSLASYYQFTFNKVVELAQENGDYDLAWFVKVDGDHVYCQDALNFMFNWAKTDPHQLEAYFIGKFDVVYSRANDRVYVTSIVSRKDHFFYKLSAFPGFILKIKLTTNNAWEYVPTDLIQQCDEKQVPDFLNSFHFKWEKHIFNRLEIPVTEFSDLSFLDDPDSANYKAVADNYREIRLCPQFFNYNNALRIVKSFDYEGMTPDSAYISHNLDSEELLRNHSYREKDFPIRTPVVLIDQ